MKLKVGDQVRVLEDSGSNYGSSHIGEVLTIIDSDDNVYKLSDNFWYNEKKLHRVGKIGDRVRFLTAEQGFGDRGKIGKIGKIEDGEGICGPGIRFDDDRYAVASLTGYEVVEEESLPQRYNIGISFSDGDYVAADHGNYEVIDGELIEPVKAANPAMTPQNAYKILHKKFVEDNGIKVGSRVTILRTCKSNENGWKFVANPEYIFKDYIGKTGKVIDFDNTDKIVIDINGLGMLYVPWYILRVEPSLVKVQVGSETFEVSEDIAGKIRGIITS